VNRASNDVTVVDGATNVVLKSIGVGPLPQAPVWNPAQNRMYVANYTNSSVSVLRDSLPGGVEEVVNGKRRMANSGPSILRCLPPGATAFDAMGRRVSSAKAGVYFLRDEGRGAGDVGRTCKVVVQR
jgi:YVTN family beta-propeller protein